MEKVQIYEKFKNSLFHYMYNVKNEYSDYVFMCIGTSNVIGDSFGPFVGEILMHLITDKNHIHVFGNIKSNVSYSNVDYIIKQIYSKYDNPCIIAIDSALSESSNIGSILVNNCSLKLGESIGRKDYTVGNISIKGVVGKKYNLPYHNFLTLNQIPQKLVINLAKITAKGIYDINSYIY